MLVLLVALISLVSGTSHLYGFDNNFHPVTDDRQCSPFSNCYSHICDLLSYKYINVTFVGIMFEGWSEECFSHTNDTLHAQMVVFGLDYYRNIEAGSPTSCVGFKQCVMEVCRTLSNPPTAMAVVTGSCR